MIKYLKYFFLIVFTFNLMSFLNAMDVEFLALKLIPAKQKAEEYIKKAKNISVLTGSPLTSGLSGTLPSGLGQLRLVGSQWKKEYERLLAIEASSGSSDHVASMQAGAESSLTDGSMHSSNQVNHFSALPSSVVIQANFIPSLVDPAGA